MQNDSTAAAHPNTDTTNSQPVKEQETKSSRIVLHHLNDSRSQRILWLLEEIGQPYEIKKYQRTSEMLAPKEMKEVHALGKAPILTDGDATVAESGAIVEYLIGKYGRQFLPSEPAQVTNLYWTHYCEGTLMPLLVNKLIFTIVPTRAPFLLRPLVKVVMGGLITQMCDPRIKDNTNMIEAHLAKSKSGWFTDDDHPCAADFMMSFPLEGLASGRSAGPLPPKILEYVDRVHARPAYKRGLEKGGEYSYAKL